MAFLHLFHLPALFELTCSCDIVATVCPHFSVGRGDDNDGITSFKATDVGNTFVPGCDILAIVLVHVEADVCLHALLLHVSADLVKFGVSCRSVYHLCFVFYD